ncbi:hypothetical protein [Streptomyces sp. NPDC012888]|uniref:hypothetical protein n=1 Tax=Streptomyces sp. NPDC012888 TaxID=3364855 RepID=UPI0036B61D81
MKLFPRPRLLVPALVAALALPLILATPASAQSAFATRIAGQVLVTALPGQNNRINLFSHGTDLVMFDFAGPVIPGPGCSPFNGAVLCGPISTISRVTVRLGDRDDRYFQDTAVTFPATVDPGPGADLVFAGPRGDTISARDGAVDDINCGGGFDVVTADVADGVAADCELVRRG